MDSICVRNTLLLTMIAVTTFAHPVEMVMASQYSGKKRRPTPIAIPPPLPPPPPRVVPGPNAFAIAARAKQEESRQAEQGTLQDRPHTSDGPSTPLTSSSGRANGLHLPRSNSTATKSWLSARTAFGQLLEQARTSEPRKSPWKSGHSQPSGQTRPSSTTRSRCPERSYHSLVLPETHLEEPSQPNRTARGVIEARAERKFFKMMGQVPDTPTGGG